jgi:nicotinamidase-related amidase
VNMPPNRVIYKDLKEIVSPEHTALIVWDVQNMLLKSIFNKDAFVSKLKALIVEARSHNVPVVYTRILRPEMEYESSFRLYMLMKRAGVDDPAKLPKSVPGGAESQISSEFTPATGDLVMDKPSQSIFTGTNFDNLMRNRGIDSLVFTGIATEMGINTSARDSASRGFYTTVVEDCVSSSDAEAHEASLKTLKRICLIVPSSDVIKAWSQT